MKGYMTLQKTQKLNKNHSSTIFSTVGGHSLAQRSPTTTYAIVAGGAITQSQPGKGAADKASKRIARGHLRKL
jgi:hypothetical protein